MAEYATADNDTTLARPCPRTRLRVAALFAGIGGIELGLEAAGHKTQFLCEVDRAAQYVLHKAFPAAPLEPDVRHVETISDVDLLAAGFPCQDLSQAGRTAGIGGSSSGLVASVFELLRRGGASPRWLFLENVPFMLRLDRGKAMGFLTDSLEELGYAWAYRTVDARAFGLPQRRQRVIMLASKVEDPRPVLFGQDAGDPAETDRRPEMACGFYWTEGLRGLGWAVNAVPTLKGGSTVGIPSPPAIWMPDGEIVTPDIRDAERLQGFPIDWTAGIRTVGGYKEGHRWKLVGNAVSVPVSRWVGDRLALPDGVFDASASTSLNGQPWPSAAWGYRRQRFGVGVSRWPVKSRYENLADFLRFPVRPLSLRASTGFYSRALRSTLRFPEGFLDVVACHIERMKSI